MEGFEYTETEKAAEKEITRYKTLSFCLRITEAIGSQISQGQHSIVPEPGLEQEYAIFRAHIKNIQDMIREMRYGKG